MGWPDVIFLTTKTGKEIVMNAKVTGVLILALTVGLTGTAQEKKGGKRNKKPKPAGQKYTIEQAVSDRAQLHTICFSGLAFITGDFGASTFIPPGKVCDYFGFQYMRDIDAAQKGHNPMFLNRVAGNVLHILNDEQKQMFADLAEEQAPQLIALAEMRLPLIKAFWMELEADKPGLSKKAVIHTVADIFERDAELSIRRAEVMARVHASLTDEQKAYLANMKFGDFNSWPEMDQRDKKKGKGQSKLFSVAYMTYASEFFSWTAGNTEADTYFCPERHGTYFGGFDRKDMPAMGKRDFDISTSVTGDSGRTFVEEICTPEQAKHLTEIPDLQRAALMETIDVRRAFSIELRKLLNGQTPDREKLLKLGRRYGELDGEMSWLYTMAFAEINRTLTAKQRAELVKLRNLEGYESASYYIYSRGQKDQPKIGDVKTKFFGAN
jgi:Spy/CpxP family protein refolding chaperone